MRISVFSDVHGNPYACQAVLKAIFNDDPSDTVVAAGDICLGGSDPAACVELLRASGVVGVYGNTEGYLFQPEQMPPDEQHRSMWHRIQPVAYWVRKQLADDQMEWLQTLPFELRYSPTGNSKDDLLVVHANPKDVELMIYPLEIEQRKLWDQVRQPDDDPALRDALHDTSAGVIAFGHFHYTFQRTWDDLLLVDVAPCSMPSIDHDPRARYTVFTWEGNEWQISRRWVEYDVEEEIAALESSDMPYKGDFIRSFM
jgi:predicted phosphodiesterase